MKIKDILDEDAILHELEGHDKNSVLDEFSRFLYERGKIKNQESVASVLKERESLGSTGIGDNVAIPHGRLKGIKKIIAAFGLSRKGIDFDALDSKPVHFFFLLLAPDNAQTLHLHALARIARLFKNKTVHDLLGEAKNPEEIYDILIREDDKLD